MFVCLSVVNTDRRLNSRGSEMDSIIVPETTALLGTVYTTSLRSTQTQYRFENDDQNLCMGGSFFVFKPFSCHNDQNPITIFRDILSLVMGAALMPPVFKDQSGSSKDYN